MAVIGQWRQINGKEFVQACGGMLHTQYGGTRLCIRSCLSRELTASQLVVILVHTRGSTWYKVLHQHTMYVIDIDHNAWTIIWSILWINITVISQVIINRPFNPVLFCVCPKPGYQFPSAYVIVLSVVVYCYFQQ